MKAKHFFFFSSSLCVCLTANNEKMEVTTDMIQDQKKRPKRRFHHRSLAALRPSHFYQHRVRILRISTTDWRNWAPPGSAYWSPSAKCHLTIPHQPKFHPANRCSWPFSTPFRRHCRHWSSSCVCCCCAAQMSYFGPDRTGLHLAAWAIHRSLAWHWRFHKIWPPVERLFEEGTSKPTNHTLPPFSMHIN